MNPISLDLLEQKVPPHNQEAEMALLGSMLLSEEARLFAIEEIQPEYFYKKAHGRIFSVIRQLFETNQPCDLVTLTEALNRLGVLSEVGGQAYLAEMIDVVPTPSHINQYLKIVKDHYIRRSLIEKCSEIIGKSYHLTDEVDELLDESEQTIFEISDSRHKASVISLKDLIHQNFETLTKLYQKHEHLTGLPSGFVDLDQYTCGLQNTDLIVIASRPSMGKTSLACSIAQYMAVEAKIPVLIFSLEMSRDQLVQRILCSEARVNLRRLRGGYLRDAEWTQLTLAAGKLSEVPLFIDDSPGLSVLEIRAKTRRLVSREGIKAVFVDYLQLIRSHGRAENRQQEISEISAGLKNMAKELHIPVIALSQLSRQVEKRDDRRPQLSDLRESGAIEQDADLVLFLVRDLNGEDEGRSAELIIAKHRNGPTGTINLTFIKEYTHFENSANIKPS